MGWAMTRSHIHRLDSLILFCHGIMPPTLRFPPTALEGHYCRYRKMQNSVYRVRTHAAIVGRLALDLCRDMLIATRSALISALHLQRAAT